MIFGFNQGHYKEYFSKSLRLLLLVSQLTFLVRMYLISFFLIFIKYIFYYFLTAKKRI